jgi:hypothetical protein
MTEVGELLPAMIDQFKAGFEECIEKNEHRREPYYILFTADWYANETQMKCVFSPRDRKPPMMLNTMCWEINNKNGRVKELWVLPKDAPTDPTLPLGEVDEGLIKVAKHLPLIY